MRADAQKPRIAHAVRALYRGEAVEDIAAEITESFGVTERTAYNDIASAGEVLDGLRAEDALRPDSDIDIPAARAEIRAMIRRSLEADGGRLMASRATMLRLLCDLDGLLYKDLRLHNLNSDSVTEVVWPK